MRDLTRTKRKLTLQKVASRIAIQNSYLSRALNDEKTHLNEDHLYKVCKLLDFFPQEIDYVFLLRAKDIATDSERRSYLEAKIKRLRLANRRSANLQEPDTRLLNAEMAYLFDPVCNLVMVALFVDEYRQYPRRLCGPLGISPEKLKQVLNRLALTFVTALCLRPRIPYQSKSKIKFTTALTTPMRTHQSLLRVKSRPPPQVSEAEKHCFMGTFSADPETFSKIKARFQVFLKEAEQLIGDAPSKQVFQINFDLFRWL